MPQNKRTGITVVALTLALGALAGAAVHAQDQHPPGDQARHEDQGRRGDQTSRDKGDQNRHDQGAGDADRYRKMHPRAAARCHDGFFTNTTDRARACSKHGGIDTWLKE